VDRGEEYLLRLLGKHPRLHTINLVTSVPTRNLHYQPHDEEDGGGVGEAVDESEGGEDAQVLLSSHSFYPHICQSSA